MKNVIILGASGNIAKHVIDILVKNEDIRLTLYLCNKTWIRNSNELRAAVKGQDIVYANLSGDLEAMAKNIVKSMNETGIKKIIFTCLSESMIFL